jgi:hypothetical protein
MTTAAFLSALLAGDLPGPGSPRSSQRPEAAGPEEPAPLLSPPPSQPPRLGAAAGAAEENFGRLMAPDLRPFRDELAIPTKAMPAGSERRQMAMCGVASSPR